MSERVSAPVKREFLWFPRRPQLWVNYVAEGFDYNATLKPALEKRKCVTGAVAKIMRLAICARNKIRGLVQRYGTSSAKRYLWNREFSRSLWDCLDDTVGDHIYYFLEKYANQGSILDLGCGSGSTGNELADISYKVYLGVDISDAAIGKAGVRTKVNGREHKNRYVQSDISSYVPTQQFDVILSRDSIYCMAVGSIERTVDQYSRYLKQGGVFIVRLAGWSARYRTILGIIETHFSILEKRMFDQPEAIVVVFRPRAQRAAAR